MRATIAYTKLLEYALSLFLKCSFLRSISLSNKILAWYKRFYKAFAKKKIMNMLDEQGNLHGPSVT